MADPAVDSASLDPHKQWSSSLSPPSIFLRRKEEEGKEEETKREEEENQTPLDPFLDPPLVAPPRTRFIEPEAKQI